MLHESIPPARRPRRPAAFTLIELLVVIAIVALLVSILVPSLRRARDLARMSVCASNLRTIGLGVHFYAQEHNGRVVPFYRPGDAALRADLGWDAYSRPSWPSFVSIQRSGWPTLQPLNLGIAHVDGMLSDPHVFYCPGQRYFTFPEPNWWPSRPWSGWQIAPYNYNPHRSNYGDGKYGRNPKYHKLADIPAGRIMACDIMTIWRAEDFSHEDQWNLLFPDNSVALRRSSDSYDLALTLVAAGDTWNTTAEDWTAYEAALDPLEEY